MNCWLFFHRELRRGAPEVAEVLRFKEAAAASGVRLDVLRVRAASVLQLDVAGIDILFDDDGYRICEANSAPGFQGLEKACAISVPDEILGAARARMGLPSARPSSWRRLLNGMRATLGGPSGSRPRRVTAAD